MGNFKFTETKIKDLYIIEPEVFKDKRGYFFESYNDMMVIWWYTTISDDEIIFFKIFFDVIGFWNLSNDDF